MFVINNISAHILNCRTAIDAATKRVLDRAWLVLGPEVELFEKSFAAYVGVNFCRTVANGTDALELGMRALGVQGGDKVATVANAGMYTGTALLAIGADPVYMDVSLETRVVTTSEVDRAIQGGVRAIVVTHLYGQAVPEIEEIADRCRKADVVLVEDCAQAHGARINGKGVGSFGDLGCFSFYPTKNLGALGDGGAVVTGDANLAERITRLRQYGWTAKYQVEMAGARNSRLDEIQAAILSELLPLLDVWNARRREIACQFSTLISHPGISHPQTGGEDYVAHLYVIQAENRSALRAHLHSQDIATDVHYPIPDHRQPIFENDFANIHLPNTEQLVQEILTLPCYPEMTDDNVRRIIDAVNSFECR